MRTWVLRALVGVVALAAVLAPSLAAVDLARRQSVSRESARMSDLAAGLLLQANSSESEVQQGFALLAEHPELPPCSPEKIALMRRIDVGSGYIRAVGHLAGDRLQCSTLGEAANGLPLGPARLVGVASRLRLDVRFPFAPDEQFIAVQNGDDVMFVQKSLPIDPGVPGVSLAVFMAAGGQILAAQGVVKQDWITQAGTARKAVFFRDGYLVAVRRSLRHHTGTVAAIPVAALMPEIRHAAWQLVPVGALAGLVLALAVFYLARQSQSTTTALKAALRRGELYLEYQPVVDLVSGQWRGAEALLRWNHPSGQSVPPAVFMPVAEHSGLAVPITRRVIALLALEARALFDARPGFSISFNLSPADFHDPEILDRLYHLKQETGAAPGQFVVEATERGYLNSDAVRETVRAIRSLGYRTAVDDFGTGYSNLAYLQSFELDCLKIDKAFVETIGTDAPTAQVVSHIIGLGQDLGLSLVAEGVETPAQAHYLRARGVERAQGFLYARPMRLDELLEKLKAAADQSEVAPRPARSLGSRRSRRGGLETGA